MATRYYTTDKAYTPTGRNNDHVYKIVEASGTTGCVWADIAAQMPAGVAQSGVYSYIHSLKKEGFVEAKEIASTVVKEEVAAESMMKVRNSKWRCPRCGTWTNEEMARSCKACKGGRHDNRSQSDANVVA